MGDETVPSPAAQVKHAYGHALASAESAAKEGTKSCYRCGTPGLVWYKARSGAVVLASPRLGTLDPDPQKVHRCTRQVLKRSRKPSTWKRGKSPGSYR